MFNMSTSITLTCHEREREGRKKYVIYWLSQLGLVGKVKHCDLRLENVALHLKPHGEHFQEL